MCYKFELRIFEVPLLYLSFDVREFWRDQPGTEVDIARERIGQQNQFAGKFRFSGALGDDRFEAKSLVPANKKTYVVGHFDFTVDSHGVLTGSFTDEGGAKLPFSGSVDAQGNVRGKADWAGRRSVLTGKIAPPALYKTFAGFGEIGQVLQFIDEQGYRLLMVGRP